MADEYYHSSSLAIQIKEILEHKWYLSERQGHDIGLQAAVEDWTRNQASRFREQYDKHIFEIEKTCLERCGKNCYPRSECPLTLEEIHELLKD